MCCSFCSLWTIFIIIWKGEVDSPRCPGPILGQGHHQNIILKNIISLSYSFTVHIWIWQQCWPWHVSRRGGFANYKQKNQNLASLQNLTAFQNLTFLLKVISPLYGLYACVSSDLLQCPQISHFKREMQWWCFSWQESKGVGNCEQSNQKLVPPLKPIFPWNTFPINLFRNKTCAS